MGHHIIQLKSVREVIQPPALCCLIERLFPQVFVFKKSLVVGGENIECSPAARGFMFGKFFEVGCDGQWSGAIN